MLCDIYVIDKIFVLEYFHGESAKIYYTNIQHVDILYTKISRVMVGSQLAVNFH